MKCLIVILAAASLGAQGCGATSIGWNVMPEEDADELHAPESHGKTLEIGKEMNAVYENEDGFASSTGTKEVDCGDGNKCQITLHMGNPRPAPGEGEMLRITFLNSAGNAIPIDEARSAGGTDVKSADGRRVEYPRLLDNPLTVTLSRCGKITIHVSVSEGQTPNLQSSWRVTLGSARCN